MKQKPYASERSPAPIIAVLVVLIAVALYWWHNRQQQEAPPPPAPAVAEAPAPTVEPPPQPAQPEIQHPVTPPPDDTDPALAAGDLNAGLMALLGNQTVLSMLNTDHFAQRVVATVDNLGRSLAAPAVWPVHPAPGRFTVDAKGDRLYIGAANAKRYAQFVKLATAAGPDRLVALYRKFYPEFQHAYEEIGYSRGYFNDRLVEVIDILLATPEPDETPQVLLTQVQGPTAPERPWTRYEYADPGLESLPAGQRILLRMSAQDRKTVKDRLAAVRAALVSNPS
ncbi:DUF3014 domain-containing protein [Pigmentiphaga soli]|uniref:DUF3014 domain-containing protein n=1 Tax=Pigmentiphaga soli TaxID=1007095 RepID=A0ABP8H1H3_9BURK